MNKFKILTQTEEVCLINCKPSIDDIFIVLGLNPITAPTSYEEVYKRNRIYSELLTRPELREQIKNFNPEPTIPRNESDFLKFYFNPDPKKGLLYFKDLEILAQIFQQSVKSDWLQQTGKHILKTLPEVQKEEIAAAKIVKTTVEKATNIQGEFTISFYSKQEESLSTDGKKKIKILWRSRDSLLKEKVFGYRKHFYGLHNQLKVTIPKWIDKGFWKSFGIYALYEKKRVKEVNKKNKENFYKDLILTRVPPEIRSDIEKALKDTILNNPDFEIAFPKEEITINLFFSYNGEALIISILDIMATDKNDRETWHPIDFNYNNIVDNSNAELSKLSEEFVKINQKKKHHSKVLQKVHAIPNVCKMFEAGVVAIPAEKTEKEYNFISVSHLYQLPEVIDTFEKSNLYRAEIMPLINDLKVMVDQIEKLVAIANVWKLPLTTPTIITDKDIVAFDKIYPIHLIGRKDVNGKEMEAKDLEAIRNLPALNGQLIGLTGQNAGGKTVCHETIIYNIFLAQTGLPIFGKNLIFNPKELLGALFLERGEGSTMQLQIRNTKHILEEIDKIASVKALIVLDEVGTGTSHDAGVEYGQKVLKAVATRKVSCIFTTQLSEVATYAEEELNALNYQLTKHHKIEKGIGKPDLNELLESEGISKYLK